MDKEGHRRMMLGSKLCLVHSKRLSERFLICYNWLQILVSLGITKARSHNEESSEFLFFSFKFYLLEAWCLNRRENVGLEIKIENSSPSELVSGSETVSGIWHGEA